VRYCGEEAAFALRMGKAGAPFDGVGSTGRHSAAVLPLQQKLGNVGVLEVRELRHMRQQNTARGSSLSDAEKPGPPGGNRKIC
jgi:hypothetical protein